MSVKVSLKLDRQALLAGESAPVSVTVVNEAAQPLTAPDPVASPEWPKIVVSSGGRELGVFSPSAAVAAASHEFTLPRGEVTTDLAPGQPYTRSMELLSWIKLPGTGRFELTADFSPSGLRSRSEPVTVEVLPSKLAGAVQFGPHSGSSPLRMVLSKQRSAENRPAALLLTTFSFDAHEGNPDPAFGRRVVELDGSPVQLFVAVTPNNESYAAQWVAWTNRGEISVLYVEQGKAKGAVKSSRLPAPEAQLAGPGFLDLANTDGSKPGEGEFPLWNEAGRTLSTIRILDDGSIRTGQEWTFGQGRRAWSNAVTHSDKHRYATVILARQGEIAIETADLGQPGASAILLETPGQFAGAHETLNRLNESFGAVLLQQATGYVLQPWSRNAAGRTRAGSAVAVQLPAGTKLEGAVLEVAPNGRIFGMAKADGKWISINGAGQTAPLPDSVVSTGQPIAGFWWNETRRYAVLFGGQTGVTMKTVPGTP